MATITDVVTTPERSRLMSKVRQSGTCIELAVQRMVQVCGFDYQTNVGDLPGTPDLVNRENKWAIFVNGCFWHAHEGCPRGLVPKKNRSFWRKKFADNRRRDNRNLEALAELGYSVLLIWECGLRDENKVKEKLSRFLIKNEEKREEFNFSRSKKSAIRTIRLRNGRKILTRLRLNGMDLTWENAKSAFDYAYLSKSKPFTFSNYSSTVRVADIFCGCGGLSLGAKEACRAVGKRFLPVAPIDTDSAAVEVYKRNFGCSELNSRDIEIVLDGDLGSNPTKNERQFLKEIGEVEILLAGPPCQGYSNLNNHTRRNDSRNALYERVVRFAEIFEPEHVLIENVPQAVHGTEGAVSKSIDALYELGYMVDSDIVDLSEIGVPQMRKRHTVIASKTKSLLVPEVIEKYRVEDERTLSWGINDLEDEPSNGIFTSLPSFSPENMNRINYLHEQDIYDLPNQLRPRCHMDGGHNYTAVYGRLHWNKLAPTITSGFVCPGQGRYVHPSRRRTLTAHEAARLQFFPDFFDFSDVEYRQSLKEMIANAVPMKLSYIFVLEMLA